MKRDDLLRPVEHVVRKSKWVRVNEDKVRELVKYYEVEGTVDWRRACPFEYEDLHRVEDEIDFRFLVDSQAFCFWGYPEKWQVEYGGEKFDGWWALIACFKRALNEGVPVLKGEWLRDMSRGEVVRLFRGKPEIPLLEERWEMLKRIGEVLVGRYNGRFHNFIKRGEVRALDLVELVVEEFPGFKDEHIYKGERVRFYKKAQLLVYDISKVEGVEKWIEIRGMDELTGKADYKIPAVLRNWGVLEYADELTELVDGGKVLESGSEMEVEIRAGMLWATELMARELKSQGVFVWPVSLDNWLWVMGQEKKKDDKPYHLTLTVDY